MRALKKNLYFRGSFLLSVTKAGSAKVAHIFLQTLIGTKPKSENPTLNYVYINE